jgi:WD40 repeat protein
VCIYDPTLPEDVPEEQEKMSHFVAVGWDRRLRIWQDDRADEDENIIASRDLPNRDLTTNTTQLAHGDDIMSAIYDIKNNLIFTGGHDGTLLAWHFETGFIKYYLHEIDPTCCSKKYINDAKSVDTLALMATKRYLLSGTADQTIRFWDLNDLSSGKQPVFKMSVNHADGDALTIIAVNEDGDRLVTADTAGRLKLWDIS